jgi:hypothetical protein
MDKFLRFSDYDIFAYLATGLASLLAWDFAFGTHWVLGATWAAADAIASIFAAYIVGQIIASPAAWVLERRFVRRILGSPSRVLFCEPPPGRLRQLKQRLFPDYYMPLDRRLAERVREKARSEGQPDASGESLFWTAFARSKRDAGTYARMDAFLKLYGFCRNIAFVGVASAALIGVGAIWQARTSGLNSEIRNHLLWAGVALLAGVAMFYRYLKFHRLYSVEVFVGYAESNTPPHEVKR